VHENPATGAVGGTRLGIADRAPPADVQSPLWAGARHSFVAALEVFIHQAQDPARKLEELPTAIGIMRNLQFPVALIAIGRAETDSTWREARLIFAPSDAASRAGSARDQRMQVWAYLPAIVIPLLGHLRSRWIPCRLPVASLAACRRLVVRAWEIGSWCGNPRIFERFCFYLFPSMGRGFFQLPADGKLKAPRGARVGGDL
jgi:hypothetical protein